MSEKTAIDFEDLTTWPADFLAALNENRSLILAYHREERRVDRLAQDDLDVRFSRPHNPHARDYRQLVCKLEEALTGSRIALYHCTRLTDYEARRIKAEGLKMLTPELIAERISLAANNGLLNAEERDHLQQSRHIHTKLHSDNWGRRTNQLFFCSAQSTLKDESGVCHLLGLWGGEATYKGHEEDPKISHRLRTIGKPCVVKCALPFSDVKIFANSLSECLISYFISNEHEYPEPGFAFDVRLERHATPEEVVDIIDIDNPQFAQLTEYQDWHSYKLASQ